MKKALVLFSVACVFAIVGLMNAGVAMANPSIVPTDKSVIEAAEHDQWATVVVSGDLTGKFDWVEIYCRTPQSDGKYIVRIPFTSDTVSFYKNSIHGFNLGWGESQYLMLDEHSGFPGKLVGLVQINGSQGEGAKLGLIQK